jgi:mannose-6-phosphate isomerase
MLSKGGRELSTILQELREAAAAAEARAHAQPPSSLPGMDPNEAERESVRVFAQTVHLVDLYPHDPGVLVTLLLNHVVLAPGEAMYIDAGVVHAYTSGFGVEIMAASDNVLRAGLTPKFVDIPELLQVTNFTPIPPPRWAPTGAGRRGDVVLHPPVEEFRLEVRHLSGGPAAPCPGPSIVLCLDGQVEVASGASREHLRAGDSLFVAALEGPAVVGGRGQVAIGSTQT